MTFTRRSIIRGAGAAGSLMLVGGLPVWARGEQSLGEPAPPDYLHLSAALVGVDAERLEPEVRPGEVPLADVFHALCREAAPDATEALLAAWRVADAAGPGGRTAGAPTGPDGAPAGPDGAATGPDGAPAEPDDAAAGPDGAPTGPVSTAGAAGPRDTEAAAAGFLLLGGGRPREDGVGALARLTMLMWLYGVWYGGTEAARMADSAPVIGPDHRTDLVVSVRAYRNGWIWRLAQAGPMGTAGAPGSWAGAPPGLGMFLDGE